MEVFAVRDSAWEVWFWVAQGALWGSVATNLVWFWNLERLCAQ